MRARAVSLGVSLLVLAAVFGKGYATVRGYERLYAVLISSGEALERYKADHGRYPPTILPDTGDTCEAVSMSWPGVLGPPYTQLLSRDPQFMQRVRYISNGSGYSLWVDIDAEIRLLAEVTAPELIADYYGRMGIRSPSGPTECLRPYAKKVADLDMMGKALSEYRADNGAYPASYAFDGPTSRYGALTPDFIPGLAPRYIAKLPKAAKSDEDGFDYDYLYWSDGVDFALVIADSDFCHAVRPLRPDLADPTPECRFGGYVTPGWTKVDRSFLPRRLYDLFRLREALGRYRERNGGYPVSKGFDGVRSNWGASGSDWIAGLAPEFIPSLPQEPRLNGDPANQYLYASDGKDYKLIVHHPEDCERLRSMYPEMVDPKRGCGAYGFWTGNAAAW